MSINADTLPWQLQKSGITGTKIFALCFRVGGGIMTLGGVDPRIHKSPNIINYAKMTASSVCDFRYPMFL